MRRRVRGNERKAIAYLRVSTAEQALGPEAQRATIEAWAARHQVEIIAWHSDQGVSGGSELEDRPGLMQAIAQMKADGAGSLVVAKRDRLARDVAIAGIIDRAVEQCGGVVVSADGVANGDDPAARLLRHILDGVAEFERALIRQRTKAALAAKRAKGYRAGNVPYGFMAGPGGQLMENEGEQEVIQVIRALRADGLTYAAIAAELGRRGVVGRTGRALAVQQVFSIVKPSARGEREGS